jgi:hypothetical protein
VPIVSCVVHDPCLPAEYTVSSPLGIDLYDGDCLPKHQSLRMAGIPGLALSIFYLNQSHSPCALYLITFYLRTTLMSDSHPPPLDEPWPGHNELMTLLHSLPEVPSQDPLEVQASLHAMVNYMASILGPVNPLPLLDLPSPDQFELNTLELQYPLPDLPLPDQLELDGIATTLESPLQHSLSDVSESINSPELSPSHQVRVRPMTMIIHFTPQHTNVFHYFIVVDTD